MRDFDDYLTHLPEFEDESTVENKFPIRVGTDPETGRKTLFLQEDFYDAVSAVRWLFDNNIITISFAGEMGGIVITELIKQHIPEIIVHTSMSIIDVRISCVALLMLVLQQVVSIGKFAYVDVGFGESFGNAFGGGTITRAQ